MKPQDPENLYMIFSKTSLTDKYIEYQKYILQLNGSATSANGPFSGWLVPVGSFIFYIEIQIGDGLVMKRKLEDF